jgi:hypothetical protein
MWEPGDCNKVTVIPPKWGEDPLSDFMDGVRQNQYYTFVHQKAAFRLLKRFHELFVRLTKNLDNVQPLLPAWLVGRAHSALLGATQLAMSGQLPEAYMCLRGCLENALYAFFIAEEPQMGEVFLRKAEDKKSNKEFRESFQAGKIVRLLEEKDKKLAEVAREIYDWVIDAGAHPNWVGLLSGMTFEEDAKERRVATQYLNNDPLTRGTCLKMVANTAICALEVFKLVFRERFEASGISDSLERLKRVVADPNIFMAPEHTARQES